MNDPKRIIVVLLGLIFVGVCATGIKGHMDSKGYKKQVNYTTAIQSTKQDDFNYIVDSQQGRVLANGTFSTEKSKLAKFDEMNRGYTYVNRTQEHYTMHTRENCTSDSDGHQHCTTETYYTWDSVGSEQVYADKIIFMGREYPTTLFNYGHYAGATGCEAFAPTGSGSGFFETKQGCLDGAYYLNDDDRYVYTTVPTSFNAAFLATTFGGLNPFEESSITLQPKSIEQTLEDVGKYQLISFWTVTILLILLTIGAGIAAYSWVMADGVWSLDQ